MGASERWTQFHNVLGVSSLTRRADILRRNYLNHRFDRRSPLPALPEAALDRIYDHEVVLPPRRYLMQPGTQTIDGIIFLVSLGRALGATMVFEIGTFIGLTSWTLARNLSDAEVHTLDIPSEAIPRFALENDDLHRASEDYLIYRALPGGDGVHQHWSDSATFDFSAWAGKFDVVYIDGAHSEDYVRADTQSALKMASSRGAIVWDDYWRLSPGVVSVLHSLRSDLSLYRVPGTRLVVHLAPLARETILGSMPT